MGRQRLFLGNSSSSGLLNTVARFLVPLHSNRRQQSRLGGTEWQHLDLTFNRCLVLQNIQLSVAYRRTDAVVFRHPKFKYTHLFSNKNKQTTTKRWHHCVLWDYKARCTMSELNFREVLKAFASKLFNWETFGRSPFPSSTIHQHSIENNLLSQCCFDWSLLPNGTIHKKLASLKTINNQICCFTSTWWLHCNAA